MNGLLRRLGRTLVAKLTFVDEEFDAVKLKGLPGRLGRTLVAMITIVDEEYDAVKETGSFNIYVDGTNYRYRNKIEDGHYDVVLAQSTDRGNVPCQELVSRLAEDLRPEFMVLVGFAGGMEGRDDVCLGDVIVVDHVDCYEMRKMTGGKDIIRRIPLDHPSIYLRDQFANRARRELAWKDRITTARPVAGDPKVIVGNLISGEKLLGDNENAYQRQILEEFDKAIAVDMESFGMARGVYFARGTRHYNLHYLIVRGVSDFVGDEENNETRKQWRDYAAATAAAFATEIVEKVVSACQD